MAGYFKCSVCNFVHEGDSAPDKCPKCGAPKEKFVALDAAAGEAIKKSRRTNYLHMKIMAKLQAVRELAKEGTELNLDPPCVALFTKERADSELWMQMIKAELETHMKKGKWG